MIQVSNLTKIYGTQILFDDISFSIRQGERVGLVARNGHGKTTLFQIILGHIEPDSGYVSIPNGYRIGHLDQQISFSQETALSEACLGLPPASERDATDESWRVEAILAGLGFTADDMKRHPSALSGGFQVRLSLARLLVSDPDMLLLDEPTNYLDIVSVRWLSHYLRGWKRELMLITHDRSFMDSIITHTLGIHRQKARKITGNTGKYYDQIAREEEVYEKTRLNDERKREQTEAFIRRFRAKARLGGLVQSRIKTLEKQEKAEKLEKLPALEFSFNSTPFPAKVMLEAEDLTFSYSGQPPYLIDGLRFTVQKGDRIGVIGPNGKGKSTLLRLLAGELTPVQGEVRRHGRTRQGYYGQTNMEQLVPQRTIEDEILLSLAEPSTQEARNIAGAMLFTGDDALKKIAVLSGGEKSRVLLGKIIASPCNLLLLDEPTNHLDMESCDSLLAAIDSFPGAAIFVTHNEMYLQALARRLIVFDRNRVFLYEGSYQEFLGRVGWESDGLLSRGAYTGAASSFRLGDAIVEERAQPSPKLEAATATMDQKALRQARAELIRERSRALGPVAKRIEALEGAITTLEEEERRNNQDIARASLEGDVPTIVALARRNHEIGRQAEALYAELDGLTRAYERDARAFEEKLAGLAP